MIGKKRDYVICSACGTLMPAARRRCPGCGARKPRPEESIAPEEADAPLPDEKPIETPEDDVVSNPREGSSEIWYWIFAVLLLYIVIATFLPFGLLYGIALFPAAIFSKAFLERSARRRLTNRQLELDFLMLIEHNRARMERLLAAEKRRSPNASRSELIRDAMDRVLRHRRAR
jgi:hypothetical protein